MKNLIKINFNNQIAIIMPEQRTIQFLTRYFKPMQQFSKKKDNGLKIIECQQANHNTELPENFVSRK